MMKRILLKRKIISLAQCLLLIFSNLPLTSCAHVSKYDFDRMNNYIQDPYSTNLNSEIKKYDEAIKVPDRNYALWNNQLGSLYLVQGDYGKALDAFLKAYYLMNDISAFNNLEARAISLTGSEDSKAYKGDPYEKAINAFYVGLLLYNQGDLENAMAAFKNGILADSDSKEEVYKSDLTLLYLLAARVAKKSGKEDLGNDFYKEPGFTSLDQKDGAAQEIVNLNNNTLLVIELGQGPYKYRTGKYGEMAKILDRDSTNYDPRIIVDGYGGTASQAYSEIDVYFQASTRGGRKMDGILKGKAQFKDSAAGTSLAMLDASNRAIDYANSARSVNPYADTTGYMAAAGIFALFAAGSAIASTITNPKADIRHWSLLPAHIYVFPLFLTPGKHRINIGFTESYYSSGTNSEFEVDIQEGKDNIVFKRFVR